MTAILEADPAPAVSPVENLPVAAGKKRRGRPKKIREAAAASTEAAALPSDDFKSVVKQAVQEATKKAPAPGALTRKGVAGLVKQLVRQNARTTVNAELRSDDGQVIGPTAVADVRKELADQDKKEIQAQSAAEHHPHRAILLRMR